ncbi:hypothetical protein D3C72_1683910 [compost metagenome]
MAELEGGGVIKLQRGLADGFCHFLAAMANARTPQARQSVKNLAAFTIGVVGTLAAHDHARLGLEVAVAGERHPVRLQPGGVGAQRGACGLFVDLHKAHGFLLGTAASCVFQCGCAIVGRFYSYSNIDISKLTCGSSQVKPVTKLGEACQAVIGRPCCL